MTDAIWVTSTTLLATVFTVSAVAKFRDLAGFTGSLRQLRLLPRRTVAAVARLVPVAEAAVAAALLLGLAAGGWWSRTAQLAALGLLGGLTLVVGHVLARGVRARCNCFGTGGADMAPRHLVRNLLLMAVAGAGLVTADAASLAPEAAVAAAAGLVLGALVATMDDLVALFRMEPR